MNDNSPSKTPRTVLELRHVEKRFSSDPEIYGLFDVNLSMVRGELLSITGPSGSGKSTLLNIIGCLDTPTGGDYYLDGINAVELNDKERAGLRSRHIGFIFQSFHLLPYRTVVENVMMAEVYRKQPRRGREARARALLELVGLAHRIEYLPMKLSGGERQRVAIARALMGSPSLLLCDEPTGNLDSKSSAAILDLFTNLNQQQNLSIVIVTHDSNVASRATHQVRIVDGILTDLTHEQLDSPRGIEHHAATPSTLLPPIKSASRSGMTFLDLMNEVLSGIFARPGRMILTVLGVVVGLTALVATLGLTRTAGNRIISQFDQLAATELFIGARPGRTTGIKDPKAIPWDAPIRLRRLNGVVAAGNIGEVDIGDALISSSPIRDPLNQNALKLSVYAASPGLFKAVRGKLRTGRFFDAGHSERADRVALLGADAALRLGIERVEQLPAISIADNYYLIIGILHDVARKPELLGSVIIPEGTASQDFGLSGPDTVVVETKIGAAYLIAEQAPLALRPDKPNVLKVAVPQEPKRVRDEVQSDLDIMFLMLGGLSLFVGALGIANITLVGVIERTGEIGLRRAIGATRAHIAMQFLLESASIGIIGGVIGAGMGVLIIVMVSAYQVWTPVLDPEVPLLAPFVGAAIGFLSGIYPAMRAAKLEPAEALRR